MKQLFILSVALLIVSLAGHAQEQPCNNDPQTLPAGEVGWEKYGLTLTLLDESRVIVDNDVRKQIRTRDMDIDINLMDRRQYTDEQIGHEVTASAMRGGMKMKDAHGSDLTADDIRGGYIQGVLDDDSHAIILGFVSVDALYGFIVIAQCAPPAADKLLEVVRSIAVNTPAELKVR